MNYFTKKILLAVGLIIVYWGALFNYKEVTEAVLQLLGAWYLGDLMYRVARWIAPNPSETSESN